MNGGSRKELVAEIVSSKDFRHFWSETYLRKNIPFQLKTIRTQRNLSQIEAGELLGKGQSGISRLESPAYGRLTLSSLLEAARFYDVGLIVKFVPFSRLLKEYEDVSFDALSAPSPNEKFPDELETLDKWAGEKPDDGYWEADSSSAIGNVLTFTGTGKGSVGIPSEPVGTPIQPKLWLEDVNTNPRPASTATNFIASGNVIDFLRQRKAS